ncbi:hypothetical protein AUH73_06005 [archaeon 13_1_40CM_4_53_4]|nr:MAG: hypothetical protein AUH73_06005 [archaeon 13_1_40CM_4_53_4]OLE58552.1 MAG: hypothetical protein AUG17_07045 [Crenarchaeota archaeon 13_1_20CM_2_53_14]
MHGSVEGSAGFMVIALAERGDSFGSFLMLSGFLDGPGYVLHMSIKIERARDRSLRHVWILLALRRIA